MIELKRLTNNYLKEVWRTGYSEENPAWVKYDAPFLHSYQPLSWEQFKQTQGDFFSSDFVKGIFIGDELVGAVSYYWEEETTRWLEIGIALFTTSTWNQGYGSQALRQWTTEMFMRHPEIERVGFTTWSGNQGMIRLGEKNNFQLEGRLRKVRYYQKEYHDELYFGVLRSEWQC